MNSAQQSNIESKFLTELKPELDSVFNGLLDHTMNYVGSDDSQALAATNLILHLKAQLRLTSTLVESLRNGKIFKTKKATKGKKQKKENENKATQMTINIPNPVFDENAGPQAMMTSVEMQTIDEPNNLFPSEIIYH